ncbi:feruloyl-CoA synthase [Primorskyibacter flagellatus]|uniref:feruloyl-CoA synthase n=1 Tax=Primorskyibacter flagellatus TaxID=1387277 RepID=UPI003A944519
MNIRKPKVWAHVLESKTRADGTILIRRVDPLRAYPEAITACIAHWADVAPDRTWMAERGADGDWLRVSYAELRNVVARVGQMLLEADLSVERPLLILSRNSLEHAIMALAAQHVGIASAAISSAYSLVSTDHEKLRAIIGQITPGLAFTQSGSEYRSAIEASVPASVPVVCVTDPFAGRAVRLWDNVVATRPTEAVAQAHAAVTPDTVAKFLFTSGTTGSPKPVIRTHRMLCANQQQVRDCFAFMADEPPVLVDWAPWNHTASGNKLFNMSLYNGGTYYVDHGRPSPDGMAETIRNLREIAPTWFFNVPAGVELLVHAMEDDAQLRENFFSRLNMLIYAGAGLAQHIWDRLVELSQEARGAQVLMTTGLGATETGPFSLYCTEPQARPGNVGIPAQGVEMKLMPADDKLELRLRGPNITPGYWRIPGLTAAAFDEEGFYRLGDAVRYAEAGVPERGFIFDGRIAENFKLRTGTWVAVGALRAKLLDQLGGVVRDAVITGENEAEPGALLVPFWPRLRGLAPDAETEAEVLAHPAVRSAVAQRLASHVAASTGSASCITRVIVMADPLDLDKGEVTDKGSVNQRAVLHHRQDLLATLYTDDPQVIRPDNGRAA